MASASSHGSGRRNFLGKACVFTRPATGWTGTITDAATLTASGGARGDQFASGSPNTLAASGDTIVAGAPLHQRGRGRVYVFKAPAASQDAVHGDAP